MKNKSLFLITLQAAMLFGLVGCNNETKSNIDSDNNSVTSSDVSISSSDLGTSIDNSTSSTVSSVAASSSSIDIPTPGNRYEIIYTNFAKDYLTGENPTSAKPGTIVEIKTSILCDADLFVHVYLDGDLGFFNQTLSCEPDVEDYWSYKFMMPGCPVTVDVEIRTEPPILYAIWPTEEVNTFTEYLIGDLEETIPSYDFAQEIEVNTDYLLDEEYFGIYCYVSNQYESEQEYISTLKLCGWSVSDTKIDGFYEAYSPKNKIWLNFTYDSNYKDLEIYVSKAPITSWPKDLIAENVKYIVENTTTEIPSFEAELYVVNYYPSYATLAINGYGVDKNIVSTYKNKVEGLNWVVSDGTNTDEYVAVSPAKDIKITFYYEESKDEFNIDVQKKNEDATSWPKEALAGLVAKLGYTGEIMEFDGEYISVEIDDNIYYPTIAIYVEDGTQEDAAISYNAMLLKNGYVVAGTMYGDDFYNYPGTTVAYHAVYFFGDCFIIEMCHVDDLDK